MTSQVAFARSSMLLYAKSCRKAGVKADPVGRRGILRASNNAIVKPEVVSLPRLCTKPSHLAVDRVKGVQPLISLRPRGVPHTERGSACLNNDTNTICSITFTNKALTSLTHIFIQKSVRVYRQTAA